MSEKRFEITEYGSDYYIEIIDNEKELDENIYNPSQKLCLVECADLLNKLYEENGQLREINKDIGDDLYNCRLNKNIIAEKLKLWQDILTEYNIYTINDFEELMKNE